MWLESVQAGDPGTELHRDAGWHTRWRSEAQEERLR